jgi:5-methyltetrahydrofolate--homocysteine methyltransferase
MLLEQKPFLLADGATGTNLFNAGLRTGDAPELWNFEYPDRVAELHRQFVEAGADIILTNSFGGNEHRLKLHQAEDQVREINRAAARIARQVADAAERDVVVAGCIGPTGEIMAPLGALSESQAADVFARQAAALAEGGADLLWIETLSSREEVAAALEGASRVDLPAVCSCSFDTNGRTMMGLTPADLALQCCGSRFAPAAFGSNCGTGAAELVAAISNMACAAPPDSLLVAKANCGIPEWVDGAIRYNGTPELMAVYACLARDVGARIIGGCCGTTPEHLKFMRAALDQTQPGPTPDMEAIVERLGPVSSGAVAQARGEMDRAAGAAPSAGQRRPTSRRRRR